MPEDLLVSQRKGLRIDVLQWRQSADPEALQASIKATQEMGMEVQTLRRQRQTDLCEFQAVRGYTVRPRLKNNKKQDIHLLTRPLGCGQSMN